MVSQYQDQVYATCRIASLVLHFPWLRRRAECFAHDAIAHHTVHCTCDDVVRRSLCGPARLSRCVCCWNTRLMSRPGWLRMVRAAVISYVHMGMACLLVARLACCCAGCHPMGSHCCLWMSAACFLLVLQPGSNFRYTSPTTIDGMDANIMHCTAGMHCPPRRC